MNKVSKYTQSFLYTSLVIFLLGSFTKISVPLAEWDHVSFCATEDWAKGINKAWIFDHPPLYPFFLTALFKSFGPGVVIARLGNIFSVLITAMVLFRLASQLFNRDTAAWAVFFYLLNPVCIQGTSSMDMADTSILPLLFILSANAIKNNTLNPGLKNTCVLTLCIGVCSWSKVSSSIAEAISGLLEDESLRNQLKVMGKARASEFTWQRTAVETLSLYRELV
ncbi:MAG: glycosyltransferase family 39 protein [Desulfobacteraceae bacterium]|nr:glycosyltransferase family 39 protein [Desulfobacteraceae bacterium]